MSNKRLYIAYGSNLNVRQMAMRCPTAKLIGTGTVENYELQFKGSPNSAFATIAPKEGASVPVGVWSIQPKDERALDVYEGYPSHYYKQDVPVNMGENEVSAMVYIMNPRMSFGIPSQRYYNTVCEGYENCGLDVSVLNQAVDASIEQYRAAEQEADADLYDPNFEAEDFLDEEEYEEFEEEIDETDPFYFSDQMHM